MKYYVIDCIMTLLKKSIKINFLVEFFITLHQTSKICLPKICKMYFNLQLYIFVLYVLIRIPRG